MEKSPDAFRTISEVAEVLDTPAHVLRFWESRFPQVRPVKRAGGRRYYRPTDVALLSGIKRLLHGDGVTIRGVQKILRENGIRHVMALAESAALKTAAIAEMDSPATEPPQPETATVLVLAQPIARPPADPTVKPEPASPQPPDPEALPLWSNLFHDSPRDDADDDTQDEPSPSLLDDAPHDLTPPIAAVSTPGAPIPDAAPAVAEGPSEASQPPDWPATALRALSPDATAAIQPDLAAIAAQLGALRARMAAAAQVRNR